MIHDQAMHEWRGALYALMGLAYYREPSMGFLQGLAAEDPFSVPGIPGMNGKLVEGLGLLSASLEPFKKGITTQDLERHQWDYLRLFVGPGRPAAPPWESFYRTEERIMVSGYTLEVRNGYERFGLEFENRDSEPEDHIGLELEFMSHLCERCVQGLRTRDESMLEDALCAQNDFLDEHLLVWVPAFCNEVSRAAETDFYLGMAALTAGFLLWDRSLLDPGDQPDTDKPAEA